MKPPTREEVLAAAGLPPDPPKVRKPRKPPTLWLVPAEPEFDSEIHVTEWFSEKELFKPDALLKKVKHAKRKR